MAQINECYKAKNHNNFHERDIGCEYQQSQDWTGPKTHG